MVFEKIVSNKALGAICYMLIAHKYETLDVIKSETDAIFHVTYYSNKTVK